MAEQLAELNKGGENAIEIAIPININVNSAWGNCFSGAIQYDTGIDISNKKIFATLYSDLTAGILSISKVTNSNTKIAILIMRPTAATVVGTVCLRITD